MKPILYSAAVFLSALAILLGLPRAINLVQTTAIANNVPTNQIIGTVKASEKTVKNDQVIKSPPLSKGILPPALTATAALVEDVDSGSLLFVKDPNKRVPIASTTKVMTALAAVDYFKPGDVLEATDLSETDGSSMGLKVGEKITFRNILYGMLLNSGNDAAFTIARNYPGGLSVFVAAMNRKAEGLGLQNTHFDNPAGFDSLEHFSSASDLAKISLLAMENPQIARVVSTKEAQVASVDKSVIHNLKNLNKLLGESGVLGIKTGFTPEAKENLIGFVDRDSHKILTVVLGSDDRFGETQNLIDWTFSNFIWK